MAKMHTSIHVTLDTTGLDRLRGGMDSLAEAAGEELTWALKAKVDEELSIMGPPRSTAGEPPHMETGILREAIRAEWSGKMGRLYIDPGAKGIRGTPPARYGFYLEYGTSTRIRIAPRPFFLSAATWVISDGEPQSKIAEAVANQIRYLVGI